MTDYNISEEAKKFLKGHLNSCYINNNYVAGKGTDKLSVVNPATEEEVVSITVADERQAAEAISAAREAFDSGVWSDLAPAKRELILNRLADLIESRHEIMAELLTLESGKLLSQAKSEVLSASRTFRYYAGWTTKIEGETIDISLRQAPGKKNFAFTRREPVGVVLAIVPWNFPISIASWKLAPLLAAGCTCILKPSENTPLSSLYMADLFREAGVPSGVVNIITGDGRIGEVLTKSKGIDKITFTGSTAVGKKIGHAAMDNLTGVSLELGGKSPALVFADADLQAAAKGVAMGIFRNGGQVCVAGSRAYVEESVMDSFLELLKAEANKMTISDGFDPDADLGPLVSEMQLKRVCSYIESGRKEAKLVIGGNRPDRKGYYIEPTVFKCSDNNDTIVQEEIFGPVLAVVPFKTADEALRLANETDYGLSSTVWTQDISKAMRCVEKLDAGWVFVNTVARSDPHFPIGGNKQSGMGRELGKTGLYNFTKLKSVNIVY